MISVGAIYLWRFGVVIGISYRWEVHMFFLVGTSFCTYVNWLYSSTFYDEVHKHPATHKSSETITVVYDGAWRFDEAANIL